MKNGFRIVDSDMHIIEPGELWEKYIDGRFRDRAPKMLGNSLVGYYGLMEGHMLPTVDSHARERFKGMVAQIGADNIVWSTDYPHWDSDYPHAAEEFLGLGMPDESKRKILWDNCARLYKL